MKDREEDKEDGKSRELKVQLIAIVSQPQLRDLINQVKVLSLS